MSNVDTVQAIYEAFGRGDVDDILSRLSEDVSWDEWADPGRAQDVVPYLKPRRGREAAAGFFQDLAQTVELHAFEPLAFFESQDQVVARIRFELIIRATGNRIQDEEIHLWTFAPSGEVTAFRHYFDTLKHVEAIVSSR